MYDLIILGGGPAGYTAAERAGAVGMSAVLIEKKELGGVCLNQGCIPSKTLLHCSKAYASARNSEAFGVTAAGVSFDLATVMSRKAKVVETQRNGIALMLKKNHVAIEHGSGEILSKAGEIFRVRVEDRVVEGSRLLVCTGSEAIRLPIPGANREFVYTNKEALSIATIPKELVIIGGGAIGLEFAVFFAEVGSRVTVVELLPAIGGAIDVEIGRILQRELEKKGVGFRLESSVTEIGDHTVTVKHGDKSETISADIVLMSVGRRPNTAGIGLEALGVTVEKGAVRTDARGRTNVERVWAAGDVNGVSMLAHTAYREAHACVNDMRGISDAVHYGAIPWVIYTHPEVAGAGLTAVEAQKRGIDAAEAKLPLSYNGRFFAENEGSRGQCKVVVDRQRRVILGVHMIGGACSEMIYGAAMMVENGITVDEVDKLVFPHPTVSEIIRDTLRIVD